MGALLVALGDNSITGRLSYHVPVINMVREPERILCLYQFAMSVMAGAGLDWVLNLRTRLWLKMTVAIVLLQLL
jgi:hypothetical protein